MNDNRLCSRLEILNSDECIRRLESRGLGRIAVIVDGAPHVVPVNYAWFEGAIVVCSQPGTKMAGLTGPGPDHEVAFEIDEFDLVDHSGWSVQVRGAAEQFEPVVPIPVAPWCPDPSEISFWFRIVPHHISGRQIVHLSLRG